jgi:hypothetical protein
MAATSGKPAAMNAALVGANTVKGPWLCKVSWRFALITADSSRVRFAPATTCAVMVGVAGILSSSLSHDYTANDRTAKASTANKFLDFIEFLFDSL